ncbi:sensor histidine kinase [Solimonas marina]|uniref:ATPase n=1 Tax=Solimonas marina TaxID=2714601 RepID=A0A969WBB0_9GAMM|nr:sensor histidine kinase [Solimonas marina]NKF23014.1 ATPase [Solimonas marina]
MQQFHHTRWTNRNGAPGEIFTMAQTRDGYLWLGTPIGLVRFDGIRFEPLSALTSDALKSNDIYSLLATADGALWIGLGEHGVARYANGRLTSYSEAQGFAHATVKSLATEADGTLWAATTKAVMRFDGRRWQAQPGLASVGAQAVFVDRQGRVWLAGAGHIWMRPAGGRSFEDTGIRVGVVAQFAQARDGSIWIAETSRSARRIWGPDGRDESSEIRVGSNALLFDRDGTLWVTTLGDGLRRSVHPDALQGREVAQFGSEVGRFSQHDGLSANFTYSIVEDREGDIWVGTARGLDRFRPAPIVAVPLPSDYHALLMQADDDGGVWLGSASRPLAHVDAHGNVHDTGRDIALNAAYRSDDGSLWWSNEPWLLHQSGDAVSRIRLPDSIAGSTLQWITVDGHNRPWIGIPGAGAFVRADGRWRHLDAVDGAPAGTAPAAHRGRDGRVWIAYADGHVVVTDGSQTRRYGRDDGLDIGTLRVIGGDRHTWIGGSQGVALFAHDTFHRLTPALGMKLADVIGVVEANDGSLWIADGAGIVRIAARDVARFVDDPASVVPMRRFDHLDGLPGAIQQASLHPAAIRGSDGRLWFSTINGLAWVDPLHLPRNSVAPQVLWRSVTAGGRTQTPMAATRMPPATHEVRIDYTAPSLSIPERVRFRYRLVGVDRDWQDAGDRREAVYTNLGPGHYRFEVMAANGDGVWSPQASTWAFSIAPAFYQTRWFALLCALLAILLLWALHRLRLRQITRKLDLLHRERLDERQRIARELHDTMLQSVQGLVLRFQAALSALPTGDPAHDALLGTLDRANLAIEEGRDRIAQLRDDDRGDDLPEAIAAAVAGISFAGDEAAPSFALHVYGNRRPLCAAIDEALFCIAVEALHNAFRHAAAAHIAVTLHYEPRRLRLLVADDGRGIDDPTVLQLGRPGHWGLPGMRERASAIGGQWLLRSSAGGTTVEVDVPAARAYLRGRPSLRAWLRRSWPRNEKPK